MSNASPRLRSSSWSSSTAGLLTRDHHLSVPLDRSGQADPAPDGASSITVYAREISAAGIDPLSRPPLVFLQGGPGCEAPRPSADAGLGWIGAVLEHHRLLLIDQRGTGASSPVDRPDAAGTPTATPPPPPHPPRPAAGGDRGGPRRPLGLERWSLLGQSFGGFCVTRYLSEHAESLEAVYITGGLPAVGHSIDEVYALSYEAMRAKSEEYYGRYPQDRDRMERLSELAGRGELITPGGDIVGPERLRSLGAMLGRAGGADAIHHLLERDPSSWGFRYDLGQSLAFGGRFPLYAVIHESCWADAGTTDWAAQRVRPAVFDDDPTLLTGEHVRHEVFLENTALRPWLEVADLLAAHEWPALYDPTRLKTTTTPGAAAVYARDVFVPMVTSLETAALIPGLRTWITSEHEHDGSRASGGKVFNRLRDLAAGMIAR